MVASWSLKKMILGHKVIIFHAADAANLASMK